MVTYNLSTNPGKSRKHRTGDAFSGPVFPDGAITAIGKDILIDKARVGVDNPIFPYPYPLIEFPF